MTIYCIYCDDTRDVMERVEELKKVHDADAGAWLNQRRTCVYLSTKLDWDTVRDFMAEVSDIVSVALNVEVPKCLTSKS